MQQIYSHYLYLLTCTHLKHVCLLVLLFALAGSSIASISLPSPCEEEYSFFTPPSTPVPHRAQQSVSLLPSTPAATAPRLTDEFDESSWLMGDLDDSYISSFPSHPLLSAGPIYAPLLVSPVEKPGSLDCTLPMVPPTTPPKIPTPPIHSASPLSTPGDFTPASHSRCASLDGSVLEQPEASNPSSWSPSLERGCPFVQVKAGNYHPPCTFSAYLCFSWRANHMTFPPYTYTLYIITHDCG